MQNGKLKKAPAEVVGIDGSAAAKEALRWAPEEAWVHGAGAGAVHARCSATHRRRRRGLPLPGRPRRFLTPPRNRSEGSSTGRRKTWARAGTRRRGRRSLRRRDRTSGCPGPAAEVLVGFCHPGDLLGCRLTRTWRPPPASCSARSASNASTTPRALSSSCTPRSQLSTGNGRVRRLSREARRWPDCQQEEEWPRANRTAGRRWNG